MPNKKTETTPKIDPIVPAVPAVPADYATFIAEAKKADLESLLRSFTFTRQGSNALTLVSRIYPAINEDKRKWPTCIGLIAESKKEYPFTMREIPSRYIVKDKTGAAVSADTLQAISNRFNALFLEAPEPEVKAKDATFSETKAKYYTPKVDTKKE